MACGVSMAQQLQSNPTVEDVCFTNSLARQALQHGDEAVVLKNLDLNKLLVTVYHDAGWGNAPPPGDDPYFRLYTSDEERGLIDTGPWASKQRKAKRRNSKVASQLGLLVQFTEVTAAQGEVRPASVVEWKSHACDRVCRSTFGAETMGCIEGIELAAVREGFDVVPLNGTTPPEVRRRIPPGGTHRLPLPLRPFPQGWLATHADRSSACYRHRMPTTSFQGRAQGQRR